MANPAEMPPTRVAGLTTAHARIRTSNYKLSIQSEHIAGFSTVEAHSDKRSAPEPRRWTPFWF
jgi:hypothetical protein